MDKEKIKFEQIAAGALLKFGKLESADISLIMDELKDLIEVEVDEEDNLSKYMIMSDGGILLNERFVHMFYENMYGTLIKMVDGTVVEDYFTNLDISRFVLKKIKMIGLGFVVKDGLRDIFSKKQIDAMVELYEMGLIEDYVQEDSVYGDYEAIRVTQKGNVELFYGEYREQVKSFCGTLKILGYDKDIINTYLLSQNFENTSCDEILSLSSFRDYICDNIDENKTECVGKKKRK